MCVGWTVAWNTMAGGIDQQAEPVKGSALISRQSRGPHRARLRGGVESPCLVSTVSFGALRAPNPLCGRTTSTEFASVAA